MSADILYYMSLPQPSHVAVIDDDESIRRSMSRLIHAAGFHPVTYRSAEAFLADMKHRRFDYLVLDTRLRARSVMELHRRLAAANVDIPVVFIKVQGDADVNSQAEALSCISYLRKASSGADVLAAFRCAVGLEASGSSPGASKQTRETIG
jgi:FixJ family two-component response regulator